MTTFRLGDLEPGALASIDYTPIAVGTLSVPAVEADAASRPSLTDVVTFMKDVAATAGPEVADNDRLILVVPPLDRPDLSMRMFSFHTGKRIAALELIDESRQIATRLPGYMRSSAFPERERWTTFTLQPFTSAGVLANVDLLDEDPAAWLIGQLPPSWVAYQQRGAKKKLLESAAAAAGPAIETDVVLVTESWNELVALRSIRTRQGAAEADLAAFAAATGFDMPEGLATLLRLSNGASDAFGFRSLLSVEEIIREWTSWRTLFNDLPLANLQSSRYESDGDRTIPIYTTPFWVPFAPDSGNGAAVDLLPGPAGRRGQIIYFGADEFTIRVIAADIGDFLQRSVEYARSGDPDESWF